MRTATWWAPLFWANMVVDACLHVCVRACILDIWSHLRAATTSYEGTLGASMRQSLARLACFGELWGSTEAILGLIVGLT